MCRGRYSLSPSYTKHKQLGSQLSQSAQHHFHHWPPPGYRGQSRRCAVQTKLRCITVHLSPQLSCSLPLNLLIVLMMSFSYYRVCQAMGRWILSIVNPFLVTAAQFLPSLPQPCPLKALRCLSSYAKIQYFWSSEIYFLLFWKFNKYPYFLSIQFLTAMFKVRFITLLKPCCTSKCLWDFPPGRLCLFSYLFLPWELPVNTTNIWERKRRCFPHSSCFSQQFLSSCSYQIIRGTSQLKSPTSSFWIGYQTSISHLEEKCISLAYVSL